MYPRSFIHLLMIALLLVLSISQIVNVTAQSQSASYQAKPNIFCAATNNLGNCISCYNGYYVNWSGVCILGNPLCASYHMEGGECLSCYGGYYLSSGNCLLANPLCKTYNIFTGCCTSCYTGFFIDGPNCVLG